MNRRGFLAGIGAAIAVPQVERVYSFLWADRSGFVPYTLCACGGAGGLLHAATCLTGAIWMADRLRDAWSAHHAMMLERDRRRGIL